MITPKVIGFMSEIFRIVIWCSSSVAQLYNVIFYIVI